MREQGASPKTTMTTRAVLTNPNFADRPVQFRNTSLGGSATVQGNRLACVDGERMEAIPEIFTTLTHQPNI